MESTRWMVRAVPSTTGAERHWGRGGLRGLARLPIAGADNPTLVRGWMKSSLVVRASDCQCRSRNSPQFNPSILRHGGIWGAAEEAVLNTVHKITKISPCKKLWWWGVQRVNHSFCVQAIFLGKQAARLKYSQLVISKFPSPLKRQVQRGIAGLSIWSVFDYKTEVLNCRVLFTIFGYFLCYSTVFHLPPLRFHCVGWCWDRTQDCWGSYQYSVSFSKRFQAVIYMQFFRCTRAAAAKRFRRIFVLWSLFKGAQAWDIRSLGFSWFLHHKVSTCGWLRG